MKILLVEDAKDVRLIVQRLIQTLGFIVDVAPDGEAAWELLTKHNYQVVISNWVMPKIDGLSLCQRIRKHHFKHYIYFILLTGKSGQKNLIEGINAGADEFANKPINIEELRARLFSAKRVIDLHQSLENKHQELEKLYCQLTSELMSAAKTQIKLLPEPLKHPRLNIAWFFQPAVYVGGDTFNYFFPNPDTCVFFSIDISGHGMSSAMLSMSLQMFMVLKRGLYGGPISKERFNSIPTTFANNLNQKLIEKESDHYLTMLFGIIDLNEQELHYVQAGHPYPIWMNGTTGQFKVMKKSGFPVGLFSDVNYETETIRYHPKDRLIIYSDGINETNSAINDKPFDTDNLVAHFQQYQDRNFHELSNDIKRDWIKPEQLNLLPDDVSFLGFEFNHQQ